MVLSSGSVTVIGLVVGLRLVTCSLVGVKKCPVLPVSAMFMGCLVGGSACALVCWALAMLGAVGLGLGGLVDSRQFQRS